MERRNGKRNGAKQVLKSKNKWKIVLLISVLLSIFIYYEIYVLLRYTTGKSVTEGQMTVYKWVASAIHKSSDVSESKTVKIGVAGNIIIDANMQKEYLQNGKANYNSVFNNISFKDYDLMVANLNSDIVLKNSNSNIASVLKNMNIDLLVAGTKEMSKQSSNDLNKTINYIKESQLEIVGHSDTPYYIFEKNEIKVAILSYIGEDYSTNNGLEEYTAKKLQSQISKLKNEKVDCIILFIDTMQSGNINVNDTKSKELEEILELGVDVVISCDSIEQKLQEKEIKDGKNVRKAYIKYSLGDIVGKQLYDNSDVSGVMSIKVEKSKNTINISLDKDKTLVALSNDAKTKYKVVDLDKEIKEYENGNKDGLSQAEYNYLKQMKSENNSK